MDCYNLKYILKYVGSMVYFNAYQIFNTSETVKIKKTLRAPVDGQEGNHTNKSSYITKKNCLTGRFYVHENKMNTLKFFPLQ